MAEDNGGSLYGVRRFALLSPSKRAEAIAEVEALLILYGQPHALRLVNVFLDRIDLVVVVDCKDVVGSLSSLLRVHGVMPDSVVGTLARQMLLATDFLHTRGILNGGIDPSGRVGGVR